MAERDRAIATELDRTSEQGCGRVARRRDQAAFQPGCDGGASGTSRRPAARREQCRDGGRGGVFPAYWHVFGAAASAATSSGYFAARPYFVLASLTCVISYGQLYSAPSAPFAAITTRPRST